MQCFSELVPPTTVTHALSIHLLGPTSRNLVIAKTSLLQVFSVKSTAGGEHGGRSRTKLVLIGEYPLAGVLTSLARIKVAETRTGGEALLVSFKDAKVSLLEWDPENHRISTVSIHYYEGDKVRLSPFEPPLSDSDSKLVVDPRSRCAALRFASHHLAIIPFPQPDEEVADVDDGFLEDADGKKETQGRGTNGTDGDRKQTPYSSSFVLPITALDPALTHPVDMAFLYEYREPTFGIVSASRSASTVLLEERKDPLSYTVITLDLEQRASTTLLAVKGLPFDIWKIIPLPQPVGGSLLVGINVLVHVDQSGKTNAVGINEFARQCSDFSIADQSNLNLRLENCCIETLNPDTGDMLVMLDTGRLAVLSFRIDGRTVSGLQVHLVSQANGGAISPPVPTDTTWLSNNKIFVGSEVGDAQVVGWTAQTAQLSRKRSRAQMLGDDIGFEIDEEDLEDMEEEGDDDLYGEESLSKSTMQRRSKAVSPDSYVFSRLDSLSCLAPIRSIAFGSREESTKRRKVDSAPVEMLASVGEGDSSRLVKLARGINPRIVNEIPDTKTEVLLPVSLKSKDGEKHYVILSDTDDDGKDMSRLMQVDDSPSESSHPLKWQEADDTEFEGEGKTSNAFVLQHSQRIVQIRESEIRTYDAAFGLSQIFPVLDPATDEELQVVHSSLCEPYLLLIRSDSSVQLLKADQSGELDEVEIGDSISGSKWLSACLYRQADEQSEPLCALLGANGGLYIFEVSNLDQAAFVAPQLSALPAVLTTEDRQRRAASRVTLAEILLADLGDRHDRQPYLIVRSSTDEVTLYEPFHTTSSQISFCTDLRFRKVPGLHIPRYSESMELANPAPMKVCELAGLSVVLVSGDSPSMITKDSRSLPRVIDVRSKPVKCITPYRSAGEGHFLAIDSDGTIIEAAILLDTNFGVNGCVYDNISPLPPSHELHDISFDATRNLFVLCSSEPIDFYTTEDDLARFEENSGLVMRPTAADYYIHLFDPATLTILSTQKIPPYEVVTSITCASLEISESTHMQEPMVAVGTITERGDNYAAKGYLHIYRIIPVVPDPDSPQKRFALSPHSTEEVRAGITALTGIGGLLATAQGQKIMFRGLREDRQLLPVAFLDFLIHTTCLKTLGDSRMWLAADARKGLWFGGFVEEPPRIHVFGKSEPKLALVTAEFLPHEGSLYLLGVDERMGLHVWQFDPEHPKSLGGTRLVKKSTFEMGHLVTGMRLMPSTIRAEADEEDDGQRWQMLTTSRTGQIGLITPLDEAQYRRLGALQSQLTNVLEHPAGLNPRAYRNVKSEDGGGRGVVDGDLIKRIAELGAGRRSEIVGRVAGTGGWWEIRGDLEVISGRGLDYFRRA